jgi:hypothetical protein
VQLPQQIASRGNLPAQVWDLEPMLWFLKYFRRNIQRKKWRPWLETKANFENVIITLVFEKNAIFFAENSQKSPKIVIITSTPGVNFTNHFRPKFWVQHFHKIKKWGRKKLCFIKVKTPGVNVMITIFGRKNIYMGIY